MNDKQNLTIAILLAVAVILGAMVLGTHVGNRAALAETAIKQGNYIMVPGAWSSDQDFVYVCDTAAGRINTYYVRQSGDEIELIDTLNIARLMER